MQYEAFQHVRDGIGHAVMRSHERGIEHGQPNYGWPTMFAYRDGEQQGIITWAMVGEDGMGQVEQVLSTVLLFGGSLCKADEWVIHLPLRGDEDEPLSVVSVRSLTGGEAYDEARHYTNVGGETFAGDWEPFPDVAKSHDGLNMMMKSLIAATTPAQRLVTYNTLTSTPAVQLDISPTIRAELDDIAADYEVATEASNILSGAMKLAQDSVDDPNIMDEARQKMGLPTRAEWEAKHADDGKEDE